MEAEYIPNIAMSIQAHPDDQEFSIGATLAKWARAGCEIISVVITSGGAGVAPLACVCAIPTNVLIKLKTW